MAVFGLAKKLMFAAPIEWWNDSHIMQLQKNIVRGQVVQSLSSQGSHYNIQSFPLLPKCGRQLLILVTIGYVKLSESCL